MPWTMGAFVIGALSMIGLPPTVGFLSKWYMVSGALEASHWGALSVIAVTTLLNAGNYVPIVYRGFFGRLADGEHEHGEAPLPMVMALVVTGAATILLFFFGDLPVALASALNGG